MAWHLCYVSKGKERVRGASEGKERDQRGEKGRGEGEREIEREGGYLRTKTVHGRSNDFVGSTQLLCYVYQLDIMLSIYLLLFLLFSLLLFFFLLLVFWSFPTLSFFYLFVSYEIKELRQDHLLVPHARCDPVCTMRG